MTYILGEFIDILFIFLPSRKLIVFIGYFNSFNIYRYMFEISIRLCYCSFSMIYTLGGFIDIIDKSTMVLV